MTTPLITRLEEAAEGSLAIDIELAALGGWTVYDDGMGVMERWRSPNGVVGGGRPPAFTTSLDAALALADRVLPEMNCTGFDKTPLGVEAYVSRNNVKSGHWFVAGEHPSSPALALCIAILRANHKDKP